MAEKITDDELAAELKAYGEVIKLPIDRKKRPILIKKLNHFKAREKPALQTKKPTPSRSKQSKKAEFSSAEESEDEPTSATGRLSGTKKGSQNSLLSYSKTDTIEISPPRTRGGNRRSARRSEVYDTVAGSSSTRSPVPKAQSLYPDLSSEINALSNSSVNYTYSEFTDSDPDESMYEVENKSVNTTMILPENVVEYEDGNQSILKQRKSGQGISKKTYENSSIWSKYKTSQANHIKDEKDGGNDFDSNTAYEPKASFISTGILIVVVLFFIAVGATYVYMRQNEDSHVEDVILALPVDVCEKYDLKDCENLDNARNIVLHLEEKLHQEKGCKIKFDDGMKKIPVERKGGPVLESLCGRTFKFHNLTNDQLLSKEKEDEIKAKLLILHYPEWNIRAFELNDSTTQLQANDPHEKVKYLQTDPTLGFIERLYRSVQKILIGFFLLICCVFVMVIGIVCLRYHNKRKEEEQRLVFDMVEKIIEIVKENYELHLEDTRHPEFMAVTHVRDQLLPPKQRQKLRPRWEKAVKFIEANESRIRIETQSVQGEEFLVWRWLPACANGGKVWQGQAFGENNSATSSAGTLHYSPTPCLKIRNMFDSEMETEEDWETNVEDAILEKCKLISGILHIYVDTSSKEGCVYMKCNSCETAYMVYRSLHGWWFDGRLVTVKYLRLELYHNKFPESKRAVRSLKPSNSKMSSLAQPYHKSTLEMT